MAPLTRARGLSRATLDPEKSLSTGGMSAASVGKSFCNPNLGLVHGDARPGRPSVQPRLGGLRVAAESLKTNRLQLCHHLAQPRQPPMPARLLASPGVHSFAGNEDVGDPRQV